MLVSNLVFYITNLMYCLYFSGSTFSIFIYQGPQGVYEFNKQKSSHHGMDGW